MGLADGLVRLSNDGDDNARADFFFFFSRSVCLYIVFWLYLLVVVVLVVVSIKVTPRGVGTKRHAVCLGYVFKKKKIVLQPHNHFSHLLQCIILAWRLFGNIWLSLATPFLLFDDIYIRPTPTYAF